MPLSAKCRQDQACTYPCCLNAAQTACGASTPSNTYGVNGPLCCPSGGSASGSINGGALTCSCTASQTCPAAPSPPPPSPPSPPPPPSSSQVKPRELRQLVHTGAELSIHNRECHKWLTCSCSPWNLASLWSASRILSVLRNAGHTACRYNKSCLSLKDVVLDCSKTIDRFVLYILACEV